MEEEPDLIIDVREALADDHPLSLLTLASGVLAITQLDQVSRPSQPWGGGYPEASLADLVPALIDVRRRETTGLLTALAALAPDDVLRRRIERELSTRHHRLPAWLERLEPLRAERAAVMSHPYADGDNLMVSVRTPAGSDLTVVVYVDHNLGTVVKDAFVLPASADATLELLHEAARGDADASVRELSLGSARARITDAIRQGDLVFPPLVSDNWPMTRALIESVLRHLPDGDTGYVRPDWPAEALWRLAGRLLASAHGTDLDPEDRDVAETLFRFACEFGPGDPLRWSPISVEVLLAHWLGENVLAGDTYFKRVPHVLRRVIRFSDAERGLRPGLTEQTLSAVNALEPEMWAAVSAQSKHLFNHEDWVRRLLSDTVGADHLSDLDAEPLPAEPFDASGLGDDVQCRLAEVDRLIDSCCVDLLDAEYRTTARRLLRDAALADPSVFGGRARADVAAAAILWLALKANRGFSQLSGGITSKALREWFDVGEASRRAGVYLRALGADAQAWSDGRVGTPRYLVSERRRQLVSMRDLYLGAD